MKIANIALSLPLRRLFDYIIPTPLDGKVHIGQRVLVPYGKQQKVGVVWKLSDKSEFDEAKLKPIDELLDAQSAFSNTQLKLLDWSINYYQHPVGEAIFTALPNALKQPVPVDSFFDKGYKLNPQYKRLVKDDFGRAHKQWDAFAEFLKTSPLSDGQIKQNDVVSTTAIKALVEKEYLENWQNDGVQLPSINKEHNEPALTLNSEQAIAVTAIQSKETFNTTLIEGVTGSGKTEVYLQGIERALQLKKQILILVPEIGLTPQTVSRFKNRFDVPVLQWHSGLTDKERIQVWLQAQNEHPFIVIGTRSAIFLPLSQPGMIIVDEEHDASLKQQEGFRYNARDLAVVLAKLHNVPVVLGTATPSFESMNNAKTGRYNHFKLPNRATGQVEPKFGTIDLKGLTLKSGLSEPLLAAIKHTLSQHQQVMLFLNRRGFAPAILCHECGWLTSCQRCNAFYTYHRSSNRMICHHCASQRPIPHQCESCGSTHLVPVGQGTEQIEDTLSELFPDVAITRIDRDSTRKKGSLNEALSEINQTGKRIIIGTQMLAKGHHFPQVTLVCILDIDGALYSSDFRAPEKLAQLITQVAGRAGRGEKSGTVLLQSHYPAHPLLQDLINNGYAHFSELGIEERQLTQLPPFSFLALLRVTSHDNRAISAFFEVVMPLFSNIKELMVMGPLPSPIEKRAGKFRFQVLIQANNRQYLAHYLPNILQQIEKLKESKKVRWHLDIDPIDLS